VERPTFELLAVVSAALLASSCSVPVSGKCNKTSDCIRGVCLDGLCQTLVTVIPKTPGTSARDAALDAGDTATEGGEPGSPDGGSDGAGSGDGDAAGDGDGAVDEGDGGDAAPPDEVLKWATWPMPNPPELGFVYRVPTGLPNPQSYQYTPDGGVVVDQVTGLAWQRDAPVATFDLPGAKQQCATLALDGHDDWRLPSRVELMSILDYTTVRAAYMDLSAFPTALREQYWTLSPASGSNVFWYVDFDTGFVASMFYTGQLQARCVRRPTPQGPLPAHYDFSEAGAVRDNWTMLTWQRVTAAALMNGSAAFDYCTNLAPAGTWRLPSLKELETLVVEDREGALDLAVFPEPAGLPSDPNITVYWTSSWSDNNPNYAYWVDFIFGTSNEGPIATNNRRARCVR
jgi:hypothetical protein